MNNPNAIKWWCIKHDVHMYMHVTHKKLPRTCLDCDEKKCFINNDPVAIKRLIWMQACPYDNETLYEHGLEAVVKIERASKLKHKTLRLIYSMPPSVVHYYRNKHVARVSKSIFIKMIRVLPLPIKIKKLIGEIIYFVFAYNLSETTKEKVPYYIPELAHWKNPEMTKEIQMNKFVAECNEKLNTNHYGK